MNPWQLFSNALLDSLLPWITIWVLAKYFLLAGKQYRETINRLLANHDDLTAQVIAFKNPWAAEQFARFKTMAQQAPKPDVDTDLEDQLASRMQAIDEQDLL
jgi:hypothetical protein